jgi:hypothetical protein
MVLGSILLYYIYFALCLLIGGPFGVQFWTLSFIGL